MHSFEKTFDKLKKNTAQQINKKAQKIPHIKISWLKNLKPNFKAKVNGRLTRKCNILVENLYLISSFMKVFLSFDFQLYFLFEFGYNNLL